MKNPVSAKSELTLSTTTATVQVLLQQLPSEQLVRRCQQGRQPDRAAFTELVRRYQSSVERLLYYLTPDESERSDLAQEVWIRVYRQINGLRESGNFPSWLRSVTINLFYDTLRRRKR